MHVVKAHRDLNVESTVQKFLAPKCMHQNVLNQSKSFAINLPGQNLLQPTLSICQAMKK